MRYPNLEEWLAKLPDGEHSYPQCVMKAGLVNVALEHRTFVPPEDLPAWLRAFVEQPHTATAWVPIVHCNAYLLAQLDADFGGSVERYLEFNYDVNRAFAESSMYRMLYRVVSPSFLLRRAADMFRLVYRGLGFAVSAHQGSATLRITHPPQLYPRCLAEGWAAAMRATLDNAGAREARVELTHHDARAMTLVGEWS